MILYTMVFTIKTKSLFEHFIFRSVFCWRNTIEILKHVIEMAQRVKTDSCTNIQGVVVGSE